MFEIPAGARHVQIEEMEPASHSIGASHRWVAFGAVQAERWEQQSRGLMGGTAMLMVLPLWGGSETYLKYLFLSCSC